MQVIADPAGRLVWASPALPGARHDMGAAREHGIIDALNAAGVPRSPTPPTRAAGRRSGFRSVGAAWIPTPAATGVCLARRRRSTPPTPASAGPGERANAQLKSWQVLRKIRSCPRRATALVKAVTVLIQTG